MNHNHNIFKFFNHCVDFLRNTIIRIEHCIFFTAEIVFQLFSEFFDKKEYDIVFKKRIKNELKPHKLYIFYYFDTFNSKLSKLEKGHHGNIVGYAYQFVTENKLNTLK